MATPQPSRAQNPPDDPRPPPFARDPRGATPAMAQWFAAKEAHPDALVFFRMGDFYELFFADAEAAAAALDIALTQRGEHDGRPIPMCGVPQHAAEAYLARLIRRGFRVAVAEQMEDPKAAHRQGADPPRGGASGHARHDHRGGAAGGRPRQPAARPWRRTATASARPGSMCPPACSRPPRSRTAELPGAARPTGAGGDPGAARRCRSASGTASARPKSRRRRRWWRGGGWPRRSASPAWTRSAASPTPRRSPR